MHITPLRTAKAHRALESACGRDLFRDFLSLAYDVAAGNGDWTQLAAGLAELLDCKPLVIFVAGPNARVDVLGSFGELARDHVQLCRQAARDQWRWSGKRCFAHVPVGAASFPPPGSSSGRPARWNDVTGTAPLHVAGKNLDEAADDCVCIAYGVPAGGGDPAKMPESTIEAVLPHLVRAVQIERRLRAASDQSQADQTIIDSLPFGIFQLDPQGRIISANAEALTVARQRKGLTVTTNRLHATAGGDDARLQKAIAAVLASGSSANACCLSIGRGPGLRPYAVLVTAVGARSKTMSLRTACVVFVGDPDGQRAPSAEAIADSFGLTPAESRIVAGITAGLSLAETAARLEVSVNTARTLLSRAMAKTATNSQIALVRLVLMTLTLVGAGS